MTAKGSIYGASGASTPAELGVGSNDTILIADSGEATGLKWIGRSGTGELANVAASEAAGSDDTVPRGDHVHALGIGTTRGDLLVWNNTPVASRLALGAAGTVLIGGANDPSYSGSPALSGTLTVDIINEYTGAAGVTVDGILHKDNALYPDFDNFPNFWLGVSSPSKPTIAFDGFDYILLESDVMMFSVGSVRMQLSASGLQTNVINELGAGVGVTIDSVLLKDGLVDGIDVANHGISAHTGHADWKVLYTDGSGDEQETAVGTDGQVYKGTSATGAPAFEDDEAGIEFMIDGGGSTISTGTAGWLAVPFACTIKAVRLLADQSGAIKIDLWVDSYANYPPTNDDTITGGNEPEIAASGVKDEDTSLTSWTTALAKGDIIYYNVDSVTAIERCLVVLEVDKT